MAPSAVSINSIPSVEIKGKLQPDVVVDREEDITPLRKISHGALMPGIPTFSSFEEERRHILIHMAATFRDWARKGFTEGMSGHISVRDPEYPNAIWMNPLGKHFGLMTAGDFLCLDMHTGAIIGGNKNGTANSAGFFIHSEVHKARPDIHAVCHSHTNAGRAWSVFAKGIDMLNQDTCLLYDSIAVYADYAGIVFAAEEGRNIARSLGAKNKVAILLNHGLLSVGSTVDEAGFLFGLLDRGCAIQLQVETACAGNPSLKKNIISDEEAAHVFKDASEKNILYREAQPDLEYEIEMAGLNIVSRGVENQKIDIPA